MVTLRTIYRRFTSNVSPPHKRKTSPWDRLLHFRAWRMLEILFQEIDNLESASDQVKIDFSKWKVESFVRKKKKKKRFLHFKRTIYSNFVQDPMNKIRNLRRMKIDTILKKIISCVMKLGRIQATKPWRNSRSLASHFLQPSLYNLPVNETRILLSRGGSESQLRFRSPKNLR